MRRLLCLGCLACFLSAATLDKLAIAVGYTVITELQIDEDLRVAALLNGQPVNRDLDSRRAAADRLVEQMLIWHEIEISEYPRPSAQEVDTLLEKITETLGGRQHLDQLMRQYEVTGQILRAHLSAQLATLRFIDFRFRTDVNVTDSEINTEYRQRSGASAPPLSANGRVQLLRLMTEERTDAALTSWLAETRKQINIVYLDTGLR